MVQCQYGFDQAGNSTGRFEVADVGFDRTDQQRLIRLASFSVNRGRGAQLHRIAVFRPRSVGFQILNLRRCDSGVFEGFADHAGLRFSTGRSDAAAESVVDDRAATNDRHDPIAVTLRITEPFQDNDAATFASTKPVGIGGERFATAVRRKQTGLRHQQ